MNLSSPMLPCVQEYKMKCFSNLQDDHFSTNNSVLAGGDTGNIVNGASDVTETISATLTHTASPSKSAIKHKASKSLIDMGTEPLTTKSRSLSWRSDVRESVAPSTVTVTPVKQSQHTDSFSSQISSADSAISRTSISPIDTDRAAVPRYTMSLPRQRKGKSVKKMRFSSLQNPSTKYDSLPRVSITGHYVVYIL